MIIRRLIPFGHEDSSNEETLIRQTVYDPASHCMQPRNTSQLKPSHVNRSKKTVPVSLLLYYHV